MIRKVKIDRNSKTTTKVETEMNESKSRRNIALKIFHPSMILVISAVIVGCAGLPNGKSKITTEKGNLVGINYLTKDELVKYVNRKYSNESDREIELKMIPVGGKVILDRKPDMRFVYMRISLNDQIIKMCNDKSEREFSTYKGFAPQIGDQYSTEYYYECGINQNVPPEFEVALLDSGKSVLKSYHVNNNPN